MTRCLLSLLLAALTSVSGCAGTTSVQENHPLIAPASAVDRTRVYFIRPDPGFRGVMNPPLAIFLGGSKILDLAKGQYTVLSLKPGVAEMKLDYYTVQGPSNAMRPVSEKSQLTLTPGGTHYLVFTLVWGGPIPGSTFVPRLVSREKALEAARGLTPVGTAVREPLE